MPTHTVVQGECLISIADKYGFFWETLWNHPENAELKQKRTDPEILNPGDLVFIPEKRIKEVSEPTDQVHKYRLKNTPAKFRVRLLDDAGEPRANLQYILEIDGQEFTGKTSSSGEIRVSVPPESQKGTLILVDENEEYEKGDGECPTQVSIPIIRSE